MKGGEGEDGEEEDAFDDGGRGWRERARTETSIMRSTVGGEDGGRGRGRRRASCVRRWGRGSESRKGEGIHAR